MNHNLIIATRCLHYIKWSHDEYRTWPLITSYSNWVHEFIHGTDEYRIGYNIEYVRVLKTRMRENHGNNKWARWWNEY